MFAVILYIYIYHVKGVISVILYIYIYHVKGVIAVILYIYIHHVKEGDFRASTLTLSINGFSGQ